MAEIDEGPLAVYLGRCPECVIESPRFTAKSETEAWLSNHWMATHATDHVVSTLLTESE